MTCQRGWPSNWNTGDPLRTNGGQGCRQRLQNAVLTTEQVVLTMEHLSKTVTEIGQDAADVGATVSGIEGQCRGAGGM